MDSTYSSQNLPNWTAPAETPHRQSHPQSRGVQHDAMRGAAESLLSESSFQAEGRSHLYMRPIEPLSQMSIGNIFDTHGLPDQNYANSGPPNSTSGSFDEPSLFDNEYGMLGDQKSCHPQPLGGPCATLSGDGANYHHFNVAMGNIRDPVAPEAYHWTQAVGLPAQDLTTQASLPYIKSEFQDFVDEETRDPAAASVSEFALARIGSHWTLYCFATWRAVKLTGRVSRPNPKEQWIPDLTDVVEPLLPEGITKTRSKEAHALARRLYKAIAISARARTAGWERYVTPLMMTASSIPPFTALCLRGDLESEEAPALEYGSPDWPGSPIDWAVTLIEPYKLKVWSDT